ncbi:hypothetical protein Micbo1qcDRAFT_159639 [Microdochium bolleyi]|uniref:Uncharacterized protein n=1 Tax=Microdochium bolleyi TaxID=196109 RepID=A0A136JBB5_9PEZI|nr:hypothetical protein Micbo1qcDRAFT_159639 [Microdochium bolleyi]
MFDIFEKRHHERRFTYWYIDTESDRDPGNDQRLQGSKRRADTRGDAIKKHRDTGLYVVSGYLYTAASNPHRSPEAESARTDDQQGQRQDRQPPPSPTMSTARLPTSVWTSLDRANQAAFALARANTEVDALTADDMDAKAWETLMKPALCQAWQRTQTGEDTLFECTLDIPDVLRDRLGYDAIGVEVAWVEPGRGANKKTPMGLTLAELPKV